MKTGIAVYSLMPTNDLLPEEIFNHRAGDGDRYRLAEAKPRAVLITFLRNLFNPAPKICDCGFACRLCR